MMNKIRDREPKLVEYHPDHNLKIMVELGRSKADKEVYRIDSVNIFGVDITNQFDSFSYSSEGDLNQHFKEGFTNVQIAIKILKNQKRRLRNEIQN